MSTEEQPDEKQLEKPASTPLTIEQIRARGLSVKRRYCLAHLVDGSDVILQSLATTEKREWRQSTLKKDGSIDPKKHEYSNDVLLAMTIVDATGATAYTVDEALNGIFDLWDTGDTTRLAEIAGAHCGVYVERKDVEAALKNCAMTPGSNFSGN